MKNQQPIHFGARIPGKILINALMQVVAMPHNKQWAVKVDEKANQVFILCVRGYGQKMEVVPRVQMKIVGPVVSDYMYTCVTFELVVEGLRNILAEKKFLADFESIKGELTEALRKYKVRPYRTYFELPDMHLVPN